MMRRLTGDFNDCGRNGYLAESGGAFFFITSGLPPIPVPRGAAMLAHLGNDEIIALSAGVPARERRSPYVSE
jgi:hypothetical protein